MKSEWEAMLGKLVDSGSFPGAVHRVLLWGPPATGKSRWASLRWEKTERVTLHSQMAPEDLVGQYGLVGSNGSTSTVWADGPAVRAMRGGLPLVLDEIDQHSADLRCALHSICDDWATAGITLPTGERVTPQPGFAIVATSNESPDVLPEALRSRFALAIYCGAPAEGALECLPEGAREVVRRSYQRIERRAWAPSVNVRSAAAIAALAGCMGWEEAAKVVLGEGNESSEFLTACAVQASVA